MARSINDILKDDGHPDGIVRDMPRELYFKLRRQHASTLVTGMLGSKDIDPVMIRDTYEGTRPDPTAELQASYDRGTLMHTIVFEPEKLVDSVAVWGGGRRAGSEWDEFNERNAGKLIMRDADVREVQHACRAVRSVPQVNDLLRCKHETELVVFGKHSKTYLMGRIDSVTTDSGPVTIVDLKTTREGIDEDSVLRTIRKKRYRERVSLYKFLYESATGCTIEAINLLFVSLDVVGVRLVKLTTGAMQFGLSRMLAAVEAVEECIARDSWPPFFSESLCDVSQWEIGSDNNVTLDGENLE